MLIALDTRPLANQSASRGIGMYTSHLKSHLEQIDGLQLREIREGETPKDVDIIHYPFFDLFFPTLPFLRGKPTVVTIHDVIPLVLPDLYPPGLKGKLNFQRQKLALKTVKAILTDSKASAADIHQYLGVPEHKIHVTYLAPQDGLPTHYTADTVKVVKEKFSLPNRFVLYVGDINRNKNLPKLVQACLGLKIDLVIAGKQSTAPIQFPDHPENHDLVWLQKQAQSDERIHLLGYVTPEELGTLYHLADAYCQPSLYEGFGLPVLEALTVGCPVVCTRNGSLPEVGGEAVIYANNDDHESLAKALKFVLDLPASQRQRLILEGKKHAAKFTWTQTAQQTYDIYKQILS